MRVNVISDLHLEFADLVLPGGDVLILSGDVCEVKNIKKDHYNPDMVMLAHERADRRPDRYIRFFEEECSKYREVIYVLGNHEHYGFRFDKTYNYLKDNIPTNIRLLEKESMEIDGVVFVGGTLWTDLNKNDPITAYTLKNGMNDYRVITNLYKDKGLYYKLTPEYTLDEHNLTKQFISDAVVAAGDKPVVVVTHHSPSKLSIKPRYQGDFHMNGGYSSAMEDFILDRPQIKFWTHGHTHDTFDYMIGECRVICNPRGYDAYEDRADRFQLKFVEV